MRVTECSVQRSGHPSLCSSKSTDFRAEIKPCVSHSWHSHNPEGNLALHSSQLSPAGLHCSWRQGGNPAAHAASGPLGPSPLRPPYSDPGPLPPWGSGALTGRRPHPAPKHDGWAISLISRQALTSCTAYTVALKNHLLRLGEVNYTESRLETNQESPFIKPLWASLLN